jgi:hypothetical protein
VAGLRLALVDPELVEEQGPIGVELVVADACGEKNKSARVVQRHPWGLSDDLVVDARPEASGGIGKAGLEGEGAIHLGVDLPVAELGGVEVAPRAVREERAAGE